MVQSRRNLLAALPVAVLAPGALVGQTLKPGATAGPAGPDEVLAQIADELRALTRQATSRDLPGSEVARRGASTLRVLRSHLVAADIDGKLWRYARSPRVRNQALEHSGDHLDWQDELRAVGVTPVEATRADLEGVLQRWAADPHACSRLVGEAAQRLERSAPRMVGQPGGATLRLVQSDACREWLFVVAQTQWYTQMVCLFAMMDPALIPLCMTFTLFSALMAELAVANGCW